MCCCHTYHLELVVPGRSATTIPVKGNLQRMVRGWDHLPVLTPGLPLRHLRRHLVCPHEVGGCVVSYLRDSFGQFGFRALALMWVVTPAKTLYLLNEVVTSHI